MSGKQGLESGEGVALLLAAFSAGPGGGRAAGRGRKQNALGKENDVHATGAVRDRGFTAIERESKLTSTGDGGEKR